MAGDHFGNILLPFLRIWLCPIYVFTSRDHYRGIKARFDSRMSEIQTLLQSYDIRLFEDRPWDDMRYMRRISGKFSKGKLDIALENESGGEQYTLKMKIIPGETPEQSLPDVETIQMACQIFSVMSGGEFSPDFLEKKLVLQIEDACKQLSEFEPRTACIELAL